MLSEVHGNHANVFNGINLDSLGEKEITTALTMLRNLQSILRANQDRIEQGFKKQPRSED